MKFFHWMQSKLNGGVQAVNSNKSSNADVVTSHLKKEPQKQEFEDWPNELLSIGTFGGRYLIGCDKQETRAEKNRSETYQTPRDDEHRCSSPDLSEFSSEEVIHLQRELKKLLTRKHNNASKPDDDSSLVVACPNRHTDHLPLDRFLNCPSSLEVDRACVSNNRISVYSDDRDQEEEIDRTIRIILRRCKDVREKKCKKYIGRKSMSFLVKKMFSLASEFVANSNLRDSFQELRMEKLLRRKIYPQTCSRTSSTKQCLQDHRSTEFDQKEEEEEDESHNNIDIKGYKWDRTDNEYIVLEI